MMIDYYTNVQRQTHAKRFEIKCSDKELPRSEKYTECVIRSVQRFC